MWGTSGGGFGGVRSVWQIAGAPLSKNSAMAEYKLTEQDLQEGKLQYQWRSCHGNRWAQGRAVVGRTARARAHSASVGSLTPLLGCSVPAALHPVTSPHKLPLPQLPGVHSRRDRGAGAAQAGGSRAEGAGAAGP